MGHNRLGRLPMTLRWRAVVRLLDDAHNDVPGVALATVDAAEQRLRELAGDPSLGYCYWLLTRIAAAARSADPPTALAELGLERPANGSALLFIARVSDRVRAELARHPES